MAGFGVQGYALAIAGLVRSKPTRSRDRRRKLP
jgi:hypothetical protein